MKIGFIIDSRVPDVRNGWGRGMWPHHLLTGWGNGSAMGVMRYGWIAEEARKLGAHYELYRPWVRDYEAVVFVKSMTPECQALAERLKQGGVRVLFDANVDYYTPPEGTFYYEGMAPKPAQRENATRMTQLADRVLASSSHLAKVCEGVRGSEVFWVPDNVRLDGVVPAVQGARTLQLWWSGESLKAFELLLIKEQLLRHADRYELNLVTNDMSNISRWFGDLRAEFEELLASVPHRISRFESAAALMQLYSAAGGVVLSPRFLNNTYNLGHTEWKITLGMAAGLPALCSPVPSYCDVARRAEPGAIRVCETTEEWDSAWQKLVSGEWDLQAGGNAAREVVEKHYASPVVARQHLVVVKGALS